MKTRDIARNAFAKGVRVHEIADGSGWIVYGKMIGNKFRVYRPRPLETGMPRSFSSNASEPENHTVAEMYDLMTRSPHPTRRKVLSKLLAMTGKEYAKILNAALAESARRKETDTACENESETRRA